MKKDGTEIFYDRASGMFFIADDHIQKKLNELLKSNGYFSMHEFYEILAESIPEDMREEFLEHMDILWPNEVGFISFEQDSDFTLIRFDKEPFEKENMP